MSSIEIKKVSSKRDLQAFIQFHYDLYRGNPYDVPNLRSDEVNTLTPEKNAAFDFSEAQYFLACREGKVVGRVAAIIVPLGLFLYFRMWKFRLRLHHDLNVIRDTNQKIVARIDEIVPPASE